MIFNRFNSASSIGALLSFFFVTLSLGFVSCAQVVEQSTAVAEKKTDTKKAETEKPAHGKEAIPGLVKEKPAEGPAFETEHGFMVPYTSKIPGTDIEFEMIPCPGGTFMMGSEEDERGHKDEEGPRVEIKMEPFWMGKTEVTWKEYKYYMSLYDIFKGFESMKMRKIKDPKAVDVFTAPSNLYDASFTYAKGDGPNQPAVTMTQYAAKQYTKWLSLTSGTFYRLPSEAEWEYACRAGTTTAYHFGDDYKQLTDYGWYKSNSDDKRHDVAQKKPNPWGLYDMHGGAAEWTLDALTEDGYADWEGKEMTAATAIHWPEEVYPRVVRGGSFEMPTKQCRSASRLGSEYEEWKEYDPNFPKSPWWLTTPPATGVGMRLIRPLKTPDSMEEKLKYWKAYDKDGAIALDVESRIENEGKGARGVADKTLPAAIKEYEKKRIGGNN